MRIRVVAAGIVALVALAGCSASGGGGAASSSAPPSSGGGASSSAPSSSAPSVPTTAAALAAFVRAGHRVDATRYAFSAATAGAPLTHNPGGELTVESPSGNISCDVRPAAAGTTPETECWVQQLAQRASRPASCEHDWVPGIADLIAGRVSVGACLGGVPFGQYANVLPYGSTITLGAMGCRSDPRFVACADLATGVGFRADRVAITVVRS